jgi:site-specific recombinase XerD
MSRRVSAIGQVPPSAVLEPAPRAILDAIIRRGDSAHTRRAYACDLHVYARWLGDEQLCWDRVTPDDLERYREHLAAIYARATTNRRLSVVRALYSEAARRRAVAESPADRLRGIRGRDDRDGGALTRGEAREVLSTTERQTAGRRTRLIALRDLAILGLLLRTGVRRSELVALRIGDLATSQGHSIATIRAGKGNVTRTIKLPPDVRRTLDAWLKEATDHGMKLEDDAPIFVAVRKGGQIMGEGRPLSDRAVYDVVRRRLHAAGLQGLGPHAMRATFVTLALEGGAPLHIVQRAAGHADPRTTERYWRRKDSLDDNAVDYVKL